MDKNKYSEKKVKEYLDFNAQREEFIETFFKKGAKFTTELLEEVQNLKSQIDNLKKENSTFRHQLASDDAIRDLLVKIKELEDEKQLFFENAKNKHIQNNDHIDRFHEMENELDQMANLYIASYQLHSTLEPFELLSVLEQILIQFVGASKFAIFIARQSIKNEKTLEPIHVFQCDDIKSTTVKWSEGLIGKAAATQISYINSTMGLMSADNNKDSNDNKDPIVCIPLIFAKQTVGTIVIYNLLEQKKDFVKTDFELFNLLTIHAASAIVGSGYFFTCDKKQDALSAFKSI